MAMRGIGRIDGGNRGPIGSRRPLSPAFRMAVLAGALESVRMHLRAGTDLEATDNQGRSPLILAVSRGHLDVCKLLLEAGADPTREDNEGNDALAVARSRGEIAVAELVQRAGISPAKFRDDNNEINRNRADEGQLNGRSLGRIGITVEKTEQIAARPVGEAGRWGHTDGHVSGDEAVSESSADNNDAFDLSGWQEEIETETPPDDLSCAREAATLQRAVSRHSPIDTDENWDDVEIDLPEHLWRRRSPLSTETRTAVRLLIVEALMNGRIDENRIGRALGGDDELVDTKRAEIAANLRLVLGDMGVVVGNEAFTNETAEEITDDDEDRFGDVATEAIDFLGTLLSSNADPLALYSRSLSPDLLTRDDEKALGLVIEEGMREVLATIAESPAVSYRLLSDACKVMDGITPARGLYDTANARKDKNETLSDDTTNDQDNEQENGVAPIPDTLSTHLRAIVEICQQPVDRVALAERLFDAGLSVGYREELQRIAAQDSACQFARKRTQAGLWKADRAKRRFVETNLKLVIWVAKQHGGLPLADRIQAGNIGLMQASHRFDYRRGTKFSTYAVWWIRQSITRTVADYARIIRLPVHVTESLRKIEKARVLAYAKDGREPDVDRIAALADLPPNGVKKMLVVPEDPFPIDDPGTSEEVCTTADEGRPSPEEMAIVAQKQMLLREQVGRLTPREATVIRRRFGIDCAEHTLAEVGEEIGLTRERIRQIEAKALKKLRRAARIERLRDALL